MRKNVTVKSAIVPTTSWPFNRGLRQKSTPGQVNRGRRSRSRFCLSLRHSPSIISSVLQNLYIAREQLACTAVDAPSERRAKARIRTPCHHQHWTHTWSYDTSTMSYAGRRHSAAGRVDISPNLGDVPSFHIRLGRGNSQSFAERRHSSRPALPIRPSSVLGYTRHFTSRPSSPTPNPTPLTSPPDRPFTHTERRALLLADPVRYPPVLHRSNGCSVYASTQIGCILSPCGKCRTAAWDLIRFHLFGEEEVKSKPMRTSLVVAANPSVSAPRPAVRAFSAFQTFATDTCSRACYREFAPGAARVTRRSQRLRTCPKRFCLEAQIAHLMHPVTAIGTLSH